MDNIGEETVSVVPTNSAGGGAIDGIGVGPKGEPGVNPKKKKLRVLFPMIKRANIGDKRQ